MDLAGANIPFRFTKNVDGAAFILRCTWLCEFVPFPYVGVVIHVKCTNKLDCYGNLFDCFVI